MMMLTKYFNWILLFFIIILLALIPNNNIFIHAEVFPDENNQDIWIPFGEEDFFEIYSNSVQLLAPARSMVAICGETNDVLSGYNEHEKLAMASTTKIITAILAIENTDNINEIVAVDDASVGIEGTSIYLRKGEKLPLIDLLYGLILASGNDSAVAIACHIGGTEEKFVDMMNEFVARIGAKNTHLVNSHGLDAPTHYTTAYDLAVITSYALKNDIFKEIASTKTKTIQGNEVQEARYLRNKNKLLFSRDDCIGVKTGFTDNAGRCLVNACERDGFTVVSVVLNCGPMFEECDRVTNYVYNNYMLKTFVAPYNYVGTVEVVGGEKRSIDVISIKKYEIPVKKSDLEHYRVIYDLPKQINAPVVNNQEIGKVVVSYKDEAIYEQSLFSIQDVKNIDMKYYIDNIIEKWF